MEREYIDREEIIELSAKLKPRFAPLHRLVLEAFIYAIRDIPNADVVPVVYGKWIKAPCSEKDGDAHCSVCNHWDWSDCNYCSDCGAKMVGRR